MQSLKDALVEAGFGSLLERIAPAALATDVDEPVDEQPSCCRGAGYRVRRDVEPGHSDFGKLIECRCEIGQARAKRRQDRIWSETLVPPRMASYSLDSLAARDAELAEKLREWQQTDRWLVLHGPKGTCKTGAAAALLVEHVQAGGTGLFVKPARFLERIRRTYGNVEGPGEADVLQSLIDAPFLVLDDLGTELLTKWGKEKLFTVIDEREERHMQGAPRRTIVTTNLTLGALAAHMDDEGRAWDRIRGWADVIETTGESQRGLEL
jgi:DNA replication protein DnaC